MVHFVYGPANERRRYIVTSSLIGWVQTQNDPCTCWNIISKVEWIGYISVTDRAMSFYQKRNSDYDSETILPAW